MYTYIIERCSLSKKALLGHIESSCDFKCKSLGKFRLCVFLDDDDDGEIVCVCVCVCVCVYVCVCLWSCLLFLGP